MTVIMPHHDEIVAAFPAISTVSPKPRLSQAGLSFLRVYAQIAHKPVEALLIAVVLLPAGEVSDVALAS
jgi:hypothetical protein